jgi:hypothetical protein
MRRVTLVIMCSASANTEQPYSSWSQLASNFCHTQLTRLIRVRLKLELRLELKLDWLGLLLRVG